MHSAFVLFLFGFVFWSTASTKPCGSWNYDKTHGIMLTHPVEEEIILLTFVEDGADTGKPNPVLSDNIPTDGVADRLSGEIVDSAAYKGLSAKSDPFPSNKTLELLQQTYNTTEAIEEVGLTTESGTIE